MQLVDDDPARVVAVQPVRVRRHPQDRGPGIGTSELADIATYVLHLANALEVDLGAEVERKLDETRRRFAHLPAGTPSRKEAGADA